jgi:hypothetical protein
MPTTRNCLVPSVLVTSRNVLPAGVTRAAAKGNDIDIDLDKFKKIQPAPHHKMPPPQSILVRFPHLKRQNPSPRIDESDKRQQFERRRAVFHKGGDLHPARAIEKKKKKNIAGATLQKAPPQSILVRFPHLKRQKFISKTRREQSAIAV